MRTLGFLVLLCLVFLCLVFFCLLIRRLGLFDQRALAMKGKSHILSLLD
jgi:hypothetical protein